MSKLKISQKRLAELLGTMYELGYKAAIATQVPVTLEQFSPEVSYGASEVTSTEEDVTMKLLSCRTNHVAACG